MELRTLTFPRCDVSIAPPEDWTSLGPADPNRVVLGDATRFGDSTPGPLAIITETDRVSELAAEATIAGFATLRTDYTIIEVDGTPDDTTVLATFRQGIFSIVSLQRILSAADHVLSVEVLCVVEEFGLIAPLLRTILPSVVYSPWVVAQR